MKRIEWLILLAIVSLLGAVLGPNFIRARAQGRMSSCESNEKNIGTALEMYSNDNQGHYPASLGRVMPNYLRLLPTCPQAGQETYSDSYRRHFKPDAYSFFCQGSFHCPAGLPSDFPQYNSFQGLVSGH